MGKFQRRAVLTSLAIAFTGAVVALPTQSQPPAPLTAPISSALDQTRTRTLVSYGSTWDYRAGTGSMDSEEPWWSLWVARSGWKQGRAPFGYGEATFKSPLANPNHYTATYLRHEFEVADLSDAVSAKISAIADDGLILYLNGVELGRTHLSAGPIDHTTFADSSSAKKVTWEVPTSALRWGRNVLTAGVHANARTTRAMTFDAQLTMIQRVQDASTQAASQGVQWSYLLTNTAPAAGWTNSTSVTKSWKKGPAPLGWGGKSIATTIKPAQTYQTLYAQRVFEVSQAQARTDAKVVTVADDGVIVYVNGTEIGRANMPEGKVGATTLAESSYGGTATFTIPAKLLKSGTNIISAQVHKAHSQSATVFFDAQILLGQGAASPAAKDANQAEPAPSEPAPSKQAPSAEPTAAPSAEPSAAPAPAGTKTPAPAPAVNPKPSSPAPASPTTPAVKPSTSPAASKPQGWVEGWGAPTWQDEFSGTKVDTTKWRVRDGDYAAYDQAVIRAENVKVSGGNLVITTDSLDKKVVYSDGRERWWSTGYVDTVGISSQKYGRWEIRAKLPVAPGNTRAIWPAIWLRDVSGPGEIDIMEAFGGPHDKLAVEPEGAWGITVHEASASDSKGRRLKHSEMRRGMEHIGLSWHTWVLEWTPAGMDFFMDGELIWQVKSADHPWINSAFSEAGVDLRLNTQVGHEWGGYADPSRPDLTKVPVDFLIDYVRVWEY